MKKIGIVLIISGFIIPLILLMFFGDNWIPSKQAGIIYSIMNANLQFYESEYLKSREETQKDTKLRMDFGNVKLEKNKEEKYTIPFRYFAGGGFIFIFLGGSILIKEMSL